MRIFKNRAYIIFSIFFLSAFFITFLHFIFHPVRVLGMNTSIFYLDERLTLASFYTTIVSFLIGFLALLQIGSVKKGLDKILMCIFGIFFLFLSTDEYFEIHEYINTLAKQSLGQGTTMSQLAHASWIFPLLVFIIGVFVMFILLIVRSKQKRVQIPLLLGVISYVFVLVFELIGGATFGHDVYVTFVGLEEGLEMVGGSFFLLSVFVMKN